MMASALGVVDRSTMSAAPPFDSHRRPKWASDNANVVVIQRPLPARARGLRRLVVRVVVRHEVAEPLQLHALLEQYVA